MLRITPRFQISRNPSLFSGLLGAMLLAMCLSLSLSTPVHAKNKRAKATTVKIKKAQSTGSGETRAERERRLTRECKGRPNAGACLGFAS